MCMPSDAPDNLACTPHFSLLFYAWYSFGNSQQRGLGKWEGSIYVDCVYTKNLVTLVRVYLLLCLYRTASGTHNTAVCDDTVFGFFNVDLT